MAATVALVVAGVLLVAVLAIGGVLLSNGLPLTEPPGAAVRVGTWLSENRAELGPDARFLELRSPTFRAEPAALMRDVERAAAGLGWEIAPAPAEHRFAAVVVSRWFGFRDDVEVRVVELEGGLVRLDGHSRSRVGRGDLGMNARHLHRLVEALRRLRPAEPDPNDRARR